MVHECSRLPISPTLAASLVKRGAPLLWLHAVCHIHLFVCVIWIPPHPTFSCPPPTPPSSYRLRFTAPHRPRDIRGLVCLAPRQALAWSGRVWDRRLLAICMQISLVLIKSQLCISLTSPVKTGRDDRLSGGAKLLWWE